MQFQQSCGFVTVRSIEEAYNWPVAPGNSVMFKDETKPFIYTKTRGFSPFENPVFEQFRLEKVDTAPNRPTEPTETDKQINLLWSELNAIKAKLGGVRDESENTRTGTSISE